MKKSKPLSRHAVMAKGALFGSVLPLLAADAKLNLNAILAGVTAANWVEKKAGIAHAIRPKLATDANMGQVVDLLDKLNPDDQAAAMDDDDTADDASPLDDILGMLRGKISDSDLAEVESKLGALMPKAEAPEAADADMAEEDGDPKDAEPGKLVPKPGTAMDAAAVSKLMRNVKDDVLRQTREAAEAREVVREYVGAVNVALDSGEAIYKAALGLLGVKTEGIHPSALRAVLEAQPKKGSTQRVAQDAAPATGFLGRFPDLVSK